MKENERNKSYASQAEGRGFDPLFPLNYDFGFVILDFGFFSKVRNPQSAIRNPLSLPWDSNPRPAHYE